MPKTRYLIAVLLSLGFMLSVQADSSRGRDDDDKHDNKDKHEKSEKHDKHEKKHKNGKAERREHFDDHDHVVIREFYAVPGHLPPGLAKRRGKLPPGLSRGQAVTPEYKEHLLPLPRDLEIKLPPPPHEVVRRILGRDIVMINKKTNKVQDVLHDALPR